MHFELKDLMEKLGVNRILAPYETQPWFHYDAEKGITCSAEVRMGPGGEDIEAEIQLLKDTPGEGTSGTEQVMRMKILPEMDKRWTPKEFRVRNEDYVNRVYDWETKGCNFFRACIQAVQMGDLPDIDALIEQELGDDDEWGGGKKGKIGRKAPKIKPGQLLGMKRGF